MRIHDPAIDAGGHGWRVEATVGNVRVHFAYSGAAEPPPAGAPWGDPFAIAALVPAMQHGTPLRLDDALPISSRLLRGLRYYQEIAAQWWPALRQVPIEARVIEPAAQPAAAAAHARRVATFFSGGLDSLFTLHRNLDEITDLVLCSGLDIPQAETTRWQRTLDSVESLAARHGKHVLAVETNVKSACLAERADNHGAVLISTAILAGFARLYVPASLHYLEFEPWGSHPLTDPLLSNDATEVVHDGAATRTEKARWLVERGVDLDGLRVCNRYAEFNCGRCEKCLRTVTVLSLYGARCAALPSFGPDSLAGVRIWTRSNLTTWQTLLDTARALGRDDVARQVARMTADFRRRERLRTLDQRLFGGRIAHLRRHYGRTRTP